MPLATRFDLSVRKARTISDPGRQLDFLLGLLFACSEWILWNTGTKDRPWPAITEDGDGRWLVVFPSLDAAQSYLDRTDVSWLRLPVSLAPEYCGRFRVAGVHGLLVNPGSEAYQLTYEAVDAFASEWKAAQERFASGFWIPNLTSEEEAFWQDHGL